MSTNASRIVRFWQAVETFNPRPLPGPDFRENVADVRGSDPLPWEAGWRLAARQPGGRGRDRDAGHVWRHQVFGGLFELSAVRRALAGLYGDDDPGGESGWPAAQGQSALFALVVDADGVLVAEPELSECAWAIGRAASAGGNPGAWLDGRPGEFPAELASRPLTGTDLRHFIAVLAGDFGVANLLDPAGLRVRSYLVADGATGAALPPGRVLGSFFGDDLTLVAGALRGHPREAGPALGAFLRASAEIGAEGRIDVRREPLAVRDGCAPDLTPPGRWVVEADHSLVRSEQFAVNEIMARLGPGGGIFAMHAPPGTAATAVFSDLVAAIVVERAKRLAELTGTRAAFRDALSWQAGPATHTVRAPAAALTGFEMVLAGTRSTLDEDDLGDLAGIGARWREYASRTDYFAPTARLTCGDDAWGLITARLGDRGERRGFAERFWQGTVRGTDALFPVGESMTAVLRRLGETAAGWQGIDWQGAVARFRQALARVTFLSSERAGAAASVTRLSGLEHALEEAYCCLEAAQHRDVELTRREAKATADAAAAEEARRAVLADLHAHRDDRPGLRAGLRTGRDWSAAHGALRAAYAVAAGRRNAALTRAQSVRTELAAARDAATRAEDEVRRLTAELAALQELVAQAHLRWGDHVPDGPSQEETDDPALIERRERSAAWADEEYATARTELFLAALALHKALIAAEAGTVERNLAALMDILAAEGQPPAAVALAAWQSFFLVVPVVSATFEGMGSLFAGLGRGSLGWLLADTTRAGQVPPQQVLGALWRADRAVLAGDQLAAASADPLPARGRQELLAALAVDPEWAADRGGAQRVADRLARYGTFLAGPDIWVGAPLRVDRLTDRAILDARNDIAYDGLLVCGAPDRDPFPGTDSWYDVRPGPDGAVGHWTAGHWIPAEGETLLSVLTWLRAAGVPAAEVRVVSPFRTVAAAAARVYGTAFGELSPEELRTRVGTVHTVTEADVVILVLGGDPGRPDARAFASKDSTLLNSAIGRARRRLYVIGNRETWAGEPYFDALARRLPDAEPVPLTNVLGSLRNLAG